MLWFKKIDLSGQICLIVYGIVIALIKRDLIFTTNAYFLVGGWQVASFIVHIFLVNRYYQSKHRDYYGYILLCLLVFAITLLIVGRGEGLLVFFVMLLFISPLLAIWYAITCDWEIKRLRDKVLVHLK